MILNWEQASYTSDTNYGGARASPPLFIVLHGSGLPQDATSDGELSYLQRPNLRVSYHLYIRKDGRVRQLVPLENVGWHAGESVWTEDGHVWSGLNAYSIGIALESNNLETEFYPLEQVQACLGLTRLMMALYEIPSHRVLTHREISEPRKTDPVAFDIEGFRAQLKEHEDYEKRLDAAKGRYEGTE